MKNRFDIFKKVLLVGFGISALLGCGSSGSSNDQGVSFTLYGMFQDNACTTGFSGGAIQLSTDTESNGSGVGALASLGLQNNMAQGIRTRRVYLSYFVEGSDLQPPPTSQALGLFLGPGFDTPNSSLPDTVQALPNVGCGQFELVPPEILSYLNLNRSRFPELPYKMSVQVTVSGIGTAGDEIITNVLDVPLEVVEDNIIAPTPGGEDANTAVGIQGIEGITSGDGIEVTDSNQEIVGVIPGTETPAS